MNRSLVRGVVGASIACGAFVAGPLCGCIAVSNAGLLGIGSGGDDVNVLGVEVFDGGSRTAKPGATRARVTAVSTAPSARTVVVRARPAVSQQISYQVPISEDVPAAPAAALGTSRIQRVPAAPAPAPVTAPLSVTPPAAPVREAPRALPATTTNEPGPAGRIGPADSFSAPKKVPEGVRVGYSEYLRGASTSDMLAVALPGTAGLAGFTIIGAYAGYRQAKAVQKALLAPVPTSILL